MLSTVLIFAGLILGFAAGLAVGVQFGRHHERETWRTAVIANLKRWRQEFLRDGEVQDSWLGGK
jgi:hypothetical protein